MQTGPSRALILDDDHPSPARPEPSRWPRRGAGPQARTGASGRLWQFLKLDRAVSSQLRIRTWERNEPTLTSGAATAHEAVELTLIETGTVSYSAGGREIVARAGDLVVVPHAMEHTTAFHAGIRGVALWLGAELVREIADSMGPDVSTPLGMPGLVPVANGRVTSLLHVLQDEVSEAGLGHARAAEAIAESIVIEVLRRAPRDTASAARDPRVLTAIGHMHEALAEPVSLDDLARAARMSRFHFCRLFRDEAGLSPYQYLIRMRVARAHELLRGGHCSVTEAAFAAGFSDLSRFSRTFKEHTGKRPVDVARGARSAKR